MEMHGIIDKYLEFQDRILYHHGKEATAIIVIIVALFFVSLGYASARLWPTAPRQEQSEKPQNEVVQTTDRQGLGAGGAPAAFGDEYVCDGGKTIEVQFSDTSADVRLPDGRGFALSRVSEGSLDRYSSSDGILVLLTNRKTAFISENGVAAYVNCIKR